MTARLRAGVLFDVDGTLADSNYLHSLAWSRAFRDAGEWVPMNAIHRLIGMGGDQLPDDELAVLLRKLDADAAIDAQTTADDIEQSKPAPEVFLTAMKTASVDPEWVVAVGASVWDVQAARAAGIGCIAVETGGFSQHELSEAGALHVYRDVKELLDQLRTSPIANLLK